MKKWTSQRWTAAEVRHAIRGAFAGRGPREIGIDLGRSEHSVKARMKMHGVSFDRTIAALKREERKRIARG